MTTIAPRPLDVVVVAGDRHGSRTVRGVGKPFLPLAGVPVLHHVLAAVEEAHATARIFVVGDQARIERSLAASGSPVRGLRRINVVEQGTTLYENAWFGFRAALGPDAPPSSESEDLTPEVRDKPILYVAGDAPLVTAAEIDEMVAGSDLARFDYCLGVTSEATLTAFYPRDGQAGIRMTYWEIRDLSWRQANLNLVRPFRFGGRHSMNRLYEIRHQRDWRNAMKFCLWLWRNHHVSGRTVTAFASLQVARVARRLELLRSPLIRPLLLDYAKMADVVSAGMQTRFTMVETHYGGAALDVDDADAYDAITANFDVWRAYLARLAAERGAAPLASAAS